MEGETELHRLIIWRRRTSRIIRQCRAVNLERVLFRREKSHLRQ